MRLTDITRLDELFTAPTKYVWTKKSEDGWIGEFTVAELPFDVKFDLSHFIEGGGHYYELDFSQGGRLFNTGKAGSKVSIVVFGTVLAMIEDFIGWEGPRRVFFSGKVGEKAKLYDQMAKTLKPRLSKIGYDVSIEDKGAYHHYSITDLRP